MEAQPQRPPAIPSDSPIALVVLYNAEAADVEESDEDFLGTTGREELDELAIELARDYGGGKQWSASWTGMRQLVFFFAFEKQARRAGRDITSTVADVADLQENEVSWSVAAVDPLEIEPG